MSNHHASPAHFLTILAAALLTLCCLAPAALADAPPNDPFQRGLEALNQGNPAQAVEHLLAAAEADPKSIERQLALARCQLQLGEFDKALQAYRKVRALSPDHREASRMIEALTAPAQAAERALAVAVELMKLSLAQQADALAQTAVARHHLALAPAARDQLLLVQAWARLHNQRADDAARQAAALLGAEQPQIVHAARIILAAALTDRDDLPDHIRRQAAQLLAQADNPLPPYDQLKPLAQLALDAHDPQTVDDAAAQLRTLLAQQVAVGYPHRAISRAFNAAVQIVRQRIARSQLDDARNLAWRLAGGSIDDLKPLAPNPQLPALPDINPNPLRPHLTSSCNITAARLLQQIASARQRSLGPTAVAPEWWLAYARLRGETHIDDALASALDITDQLARAGQPAPIREKSQPRSPADTLQRAILIDLATLPIPPDAALKIVAVIDGQLDRYQAINDLAAGLDQFATVQVNQNNDLPTITVALLPQLTQSQIIRHAMLKRLADRYTQLGDEQLERRSQLLPDQPPTQPVLPHLTAVAFHRALADDLQDPAANQPHTAVLRLAQRYASTHAWDAAITLIQRMTADRDAARARFAVDELWIRRVVAEESRLFTAGRSLGQSPHRFLIEVITRQTRFLQQHPSPAVRERVVALLDQLVARYMNLSRDDLSLAIIDAAETAAQPIQGPASLAPWALAARIRVHIAQGDEELQRHRLALAPDAPVQLQPSHQQAIQLLADLRINWPQSDEARSAIRQATALSDQYAAINAFAAAREALDQLLNAAGQTLADNQQLAAQRVLLADAQAVHDLAEQLQQLRKTAPDAAPQAVSQTYDHALTMAKNFLAQYPTSAEAPRIHRIFINAARAYGQADAWGPARLIIDRYANALPPDLRSPASIQLLIAATHLGQLDKQRGLALLLPIDNTPFPTPHPTRHTEPTTINQPTLSPEGQAGQASGADQSNLRYEADQLPRQSRTPGRDSNVDADALRREITSTINERPADDIAYAGDGNIANLSLAMIEQSRNQQFQRIAMLDKTAQHNGRRQAAGQQQIALAAGPVLSQQEMQRQDAAAAAAYDILIKIAAAQQPDDRDAAQTARLQILWLVDFFQSQQRYEQSIAWIQRYLADQPDDPDRVSLAYRVLDLRLQHAARPAHEPRDQHWLQQRSEDFEAARADIREFIQKHTAPQQQNWTRNAWSLLVDSYQQQADMARPLSAARAGGLVVQAGRTLLEIRDADPEHPLVNVMDAQLRQFGEQLAQMNQRDLAIYLLSWIPIEFPLRESAQQAVLRIAQLYADDLADPLRAVEAYQEYFSLTGQDVSDHIYTIAQQLASRKRFVEALHVYAVFVDSFPTDQRAAEALYAIGQTHQANEAWSEALNAYERVLAEYQSHQRIPDVKLAIAECRINRSEWFKARRIYEDYLRDYPNTPQTALANERVEILKTLDRYQTLLDDEQVHRNKDDAQFQIGRIVLDKLNNPIKAIEEFAKVVDNFPRSEWADNAQFEIGQALLAVGRNDEAREALRLVTVKYPNSPLADNALFRIAQSYEAEALQLASVNEQAARERLALANQTYAYRQLEQQRGANEMRNRERRKQLIKAGETEQLELEEAYTNFRWNGADASVSQFARGAEIRAERETALQAANRQDRINEAYRQAVAHYLQAATEHPLGEQTADALLRAALILENNLKDAAAAMRTYQRIVQHFPSSPVAEDAAWKVAQFHERQQNWAAAVDVYRDFIRKYPSSSRVADAQFALAEALEQLGRWVEAMDAYETFRQRFPQHPKAEAAKDQINWIKAYRQ